MRYIKPFLSSENLFIISFLLINMPASVFVFFFTNPITFTRYSLGIMILKFSSTSILSLTLVSYNYLIFLDLVFLSCAFFHYILSNYLILKYKFLLGVKLAGGVILITLNIFLDKASEQDLR